MEVIRVLEKLKTDSQHSREEGGGDDHTAVFYALIDLNDTSTDRENAEDSTLLSTSQITPG